MTRDELIEAMARALAETDTIRQPHTNGHTYDAARLAEFMHARCKGVAQVVLTAIEAQGKAVVPVEASAELAEKAVIWTDKPNPTWVYNAMVKAMRI